MESYQKLHKDCSRTIEQDAPIGNSKQHTNSKRKLKQQMIKRRHLSLEDHSSWYQMIGACYHPIWQMLVELRKLNGLLTDKALTCRSRLPWRWRMSMEGEWFSQLTWKMKVEAKLVYPGEEVDKSDKLAQEFGSNFTLWLILQLHEPRPLIYSI